MITRAAAASAIGCEPIRAMPLIFASSDVASIIGLPSAMGRESSRRYRRLACGSNFNRKLAGCRRGLWGLVRGRRTILEEIPKNSVPACPTIRPPKKLRPALGGGITTSLIHLGFWLWSGQLHGFSHRRQKISSRPFLMADDV